MVPFVRRSHVVSIRIQKKNYKKEEEEEVEKEVIACSLAVNRKKFCVLFCAQCALIKRKISSDCTKTQRINKF